jgi:hypothetical protein
LQWKSVVAAFLVLIPSIATAQEATASRIPLLREVWEKKLADAAGKAVEQQYYPTEPALVFLSAWSVTREEKYAEQARRQLESAHGREKEGVLVINDGTTTRDYQARQIYNFYLAYRVFADGEYLDWADDCARAMLKVIPRKAHDVAGRTYTLFSAGFVDPQRRGDGSLGYVVDVNQNAEVGLAFALLYHDPASTFFRDPTAREIATHETLASMAVQDMTTGAIPIGEGAWADKFDTAYGSYAAFSWVASQLLWKEPEMEKHVRAAGRWLGARTDLSKDSTRWWPKHVENAPVPDWEVSFRLPLLWYCEVPEAKGVIDGMFARLEKTRGASTDEGAAPWLYAHYDLMGVPREFYLEGVVRPRGKESNP